jgi:hypothetical protein
MEIVGHSAIEMTMNVYGHVNLDTQRAALDQLDDDLSMWAVAISRSCQTATGGAAGQKPGGEKGGAEGIRTPDPLTVRHSEAVAHMGFAWRSHW